MTDKEQIIIDVDEYFKNATDDWGRPITYITNYGDLYEEIITLNDEYKRLAKDYDRQNEWLQQRTQEYDGLLEDYKELEQRHNGAIQEFKKLKQECEALKDKLKFKVQENIKLSKENRNLKNWARLKGVEIKVNRKIKETNLEEFCRLFQFKEIQAREKKLKEWQDFENDLQWKFYRNCKEWAEMRDERDRYLKALEDIEEYIKSQLDGFGNDVYGMDKAAINHILNIINKVKEKE